MNASVPESASSPMPSGFGFAFGAFVLGTTLDLRFSDGRTVKVRIPEGVADGQRLRIKGKGEPGPAGPGDLQLVVHVRPHPFFDRKGDDIYIDLPITLGEAIR